MRQMEDEQVWGLFRKGDRAAFEEAYRRFKPVLAAYGMRMVGDAGMVEDIIQDLFVKLIRNCRLLKPTSHPRYYLLSAFRNRVIDAYRRRLPSVPLEESAAFYAAAPEPEIQWGGVDNNLDDNDLRRVEAVEKAMKELSPRQREILYLYYVCDLSHAEIAKMLGINEQSSKNLLHRTLSFIRKQVV